MLREWRGAERDARRWALWVYTPRPERCHMTHDEEGESLRQQLGTLLNLYEHHLDLFWKWITLYATIVSALSVYLFNKEITLSTKRLFPVLIAAASLGVAFGCFIMWSWLKELEKEVKRISAEVQPMRFPSLLGIRMTLAALIVTVVFAAFNILYSAYGRFE
jgi:drug/metabolite transporter superfamily protein YnfA